ESEQTLDFPKVSRLSQRKRAQHDDSEVYRIRACKPSCEVTLVAGRDIRRWASF
ncbi:hypothetical protein A2U01_0094117, partial [Trifolium medium]|nr:hypothetical protein [Trifolium medium]